MNGYFFTHDVRPKNEAKMLRKGPVGSLNLLDLSDLESQKKKPEQKRVN